MRPTFAILACSLLGSGCTEINPNYLGDDSWPAPDKGQVLDMKSEDAGPGLDLAGDQNIYIDQKPGPDVYTGDLVPWPDSVPWQCAKDVDCSDNIHCTNDKCDKTTNTCANTVQAGFCVINALCYKNGVTSSNTCHVCDTSKSIKSWTVLQNGDACVSDSISCTADVCKKGFCTHEVSTGCLIGTTCVKNGAANPSHDCQFCDQSAPNQWSPKKDNTACSGDGKSCTADYCKAGICTHPVTTGCLIGGTCYTQGQAQSSTSCNECITATSKTAWTFIDGKSCSAGASNPRMCAVNKCMKLDEGTFAPPAAQASKFTTFTAVDYIPASSKVWATVWYIDGTNANKGAIVQLPATSTGQVLTSTAMRGLHYRLAVGTSGAAYYFNGTSWVASSSLKSALGNNTRYAVWGTTIGGVQQYHISGPRTSSQPGVYRCTRASSGSFTCSSHSGFQYNHLYGAIFGTLSSAGTQSRLWTVSLDWPSGNEYEHIYSKSGSGTQWSNASPFGCPDYGNTTFNACSSTPGSFLNMHGTSASDIWIVGTDGNLLRYNGSSWTRLNNKLVLQSSLDLTAVYSSPKDNLVTVAATRSAGGYDYVYLYNHNVKYNRWFGPITVKATNNPQGDVIVDIGGKDYSNLWMVGNRYLGGKKVGWYVHPY